MWIVQDWDENMWNIFRLHFRVLIFVDEKGINDKKSSCDYIQDDYIFPKDFMQVVRAKNLMKP